MRFWLTVLFAMLVLCGSARAQAARLEGIAISVHGNQTHVAISLGSSAPYRIAARANPDRVELDFSALDWNSAIPASGIGNGFVSVYRRVDLAGGGARIVLETTAPVTVSTIGHGLALPHQPVTLEFDLASTDGSMPPTLAPPEPVRFERPPPPRPMPPAEAVSTDDLLAAMAPPPAKPSHLAAPAVPRLVEPVSLHVPEVMLPKALKPQFHGRHVIAIDPGHGGQDPGTASAEGVYEKQITLETGLALRRALEATGRYEVVMTRADDTFIPLAERPQIARKVGAELFISLHCDAMEGREAHGATVYTLSQNASDAVSERLAAAENKSAAIGGANLAAEDSSTASLLIDLSLHQSVNESNRFAELVTGEFQAEGIRLQDQLPHRSAGFAVLKAADMPSVLIEMGYLSDPDDAELLADPAHQRKVAGAITAGVDRYFRKG